MLSLTRGRRQARTLLNVPRSNTNIFTGSLNLTKSRFPVPKCFSRRPTPRPDKKHNKGKQTKMGPTHLPGLGCQLNLFPFVVFSWNFSKALFIATVYIF